MRTAHFALTFQECADPDTGAIGKCCRDPNYKDPWPGGMMMKNTGNGHQHQHQHDECGAGATCLHPYQCDNQYKIQPAKVRQKNAHFLV